MYSVFFKLDTLKKVIINVRIIITTKKLIKLDRSIAIDSSALLETKPSSPTKKGIMKFITGTEIIKPYKKEVGNIKDPSGG